MAADCGGRTRRTKTQTCQPALLRNDTTAADLARVFEGVWAGTLLNKPGSARREFLESTTSHNGATGQVQTIINEEAAALGKSAIAAQFGDMVRTWGKCGSCGACLGDAADRTRRQRVSSKLLESINRVNLLSVD